MSTKQKGVLERVFAVSPKGKGLLAASCFSSVLGMALSLVPYLSVYFICKYFLLGTVEGQSSIVLWTAVAGGAILGNMVFTFLGSVGCHAVAFNTLYRYRLYVMEHLGRISMGYFSTHTSGSIQKLMNENIEGFITHILPNLIGSLVIVIILFLSIAYLNLVLAAAVASAIIAGFFFQMLVFGGSRVQTIMTEVMQSSAKMTGAFSEYVRGMAEVKLFGRAGSVTNALKRYVADYMGWEIKSYKKSADPLRKQALSEVSFTAQQGQMTALVGESGGGKSTIGQLLLRFWETEEGAITIGGIPIRDIPVSRLMQYTAAVFQDTYIFADTVMENIRMHSHANDEAVMEAARQACCHDFIMKLPHGYGTIVGSGHSKLSGGEAQRISIARAILKNAPIVILDEALAYTDAENENQIQTAIKNLVRDKTVIMIAHRLKTIEHADQILVVNEGRIEETGTHRELIERNGLYARLWNLQNRSKEWSLG